MYDTFDSLAIRSEFVLGPEDRSGFANPNAFGYVCQANVHTVGHSACNAKQKNGRKLNTIYRLFAPSEKKSALAALCVFVVRLIFHFNVLFKQMLI